MLDGDLFCSSEVFCPKAFYMLLSEAARLMTSFDGVIFGQFSAAFFTGYFYLELVTELLSVLSMELWLEFAELESLPLLTW